MMISLLSATLPLLCGTVAEGEPPLAATLVAEASIPHPEPSLNDEKSQRSLLIIKPEAVAHHQVGAILQQVEEAPLAIVAIQMTQLSLDDAKRFYTIHQERSFFDELTAYMSSGPVVAVAVEGPQAVAALRRLIGSTNPQEAAAGTLRQRFGSSIQHNAVHGSDSPEHAHDEIAFFFAPSQLYPSKRPQQPALQLLSHSSVGDKPSIDNCLLATAKAVPAVRSPS